MRKSARIRADFSASHPTLLHILIIRCDNASTQR
jgi:hypothetical protein